MQRFGIQGDNILGISIVELRKIAKHIGKNHDLACRLWDSRIHEARLLAAFIDDPAQVHEKQMDLWVKDFNSWDICDQVYSGLFDKTPYSFSKAKEWSGAEQEFIRRAGFALMAALSVHDKKAHDKQFIKFFPIIIKYAVDERNFVKKAVNWALRQIGKRNKTLNIQAVKTAEDIIKLHPKSSSARWIARDALRELKSDQVRKRLLKKSKPRSSNTEGYNTEG